MSTEKQRLKNFYNTSVQYQNVLSNLSHYNRDVSLDEYAKVVHEFAPDSMVSDVGCGTGETTRRLQANGLRAIGVDISLLFLRTLESEIERTADFVSADIARLRFRHAPAECVALHEVIEHIPDVERFLAESLRALRPNGRAIIVSPNLLSPIKLIRHLLGIERFNVKFYGSSVRTFFAIFGNIIRNLRKNFFRMPHFAFREPILEGFQCRDDDAVSLANYLDFKQWFGMHGMKARYHQLKPDTAGIRGRLKSGLLALFPWLDKGCVLVAERSTSGAPQSQ